MNPELQKKCIDTIRFLAVDAVEKANSGHPGMPMGAAPMAFVLWSRHLRFNPNEPRWANRDRFVLSAGHGSMLIYAMLHLAGFDVTMDDLKSFRQYGSKTPGHPEFHDTPGVEATTGPLGQGISNAVGMALSQRMLAARMNGGGAFPVDNFVYGICSDGDLMEGVASEACSLAGHLKLGNLIFLYDDNRVSLAGPTEVTFTEDRGKRFEAYGWHVQRIDDGNDVEAIDRAIRAAKADSRPSLISVRTVIGFGAPHKSNTYEVHGSPLGKDEAKAAKQNLGWPLEPAFLVPDEVRRFWAGRIEELKKGYEDWQRRFSEWQRASPQKAKLWSALADQKVPEDLPEQLAAAVANATAPESTRKHGQAIIQKAAQLLPGLVGGSADLDPSTFTYVKDGGDVQAENYAGRNIHFGVREHGMGAVVNGFAYDGFFLPYSATFLLFADYMRPPIRLAALSKLHSIFVFTHDSIFLGEDGPMSGGPPMPPRPPRPGRPRSSARKGPRRSRSRGKSCRSCSGAGRRTSARRCAARTPWSTSRIRIWSSWPPAAKCRPRSRRSSSSTSRSRSAWSRCPAWSVSSAGRAKSSAGSFPTGGRRWWRWRRPVGSTGTGSSATA